MPRGCKTSKVPNSGANGGPKCRDTKSQDRARAGVKAEPRTNTDTRGSQRKRWIRPADRQVRVQGSGVRRPIGEVSSGEQRSTIRTVITRQNARPMTNATFAITVGTRVPRTAHFNRVPVELVAINPRWARVRLRAGRRSDSRRQSAHAQDRGDPRRVMASRRNAKAKDGPWAVLFSSGATRCNAATGAWEPR